jgi:hypothetical protein
MFGGLCSQGGGADSSSFLAEGKGKWNELSFFLFYKKKPNYCPWFIASENIV